MSVASLFLFGDHPAQRRVVSLPAHLVLSGGFQDALTHFDPADFLDRVLSLRKSVFVDEQRVPLSEELDEFDESAIHLGIFADLDQPLQATARILLPGGNRSEYAKIGRVAVARSERGTGLGRDVMELAHDLITQLGIEQSVLDAQVTVVEFYEKLGYQSEGGIFLDAGIEHQKMRRCKH